MRNVTIHPRRNGTRNLRVREFTDTLALPIRYKYRAKQGPKANPLLRKAWRLSQLGWTQEEIGERLGVVQSVVSLDIENSYLGNIAGLLGDHWNASGSSLLIALARVTMLHSRPQQRPPDLWPCRH